jgi:hypothetical protein
MGWLEKTLRKVSSHLRPASQMAGSGLVMTGNSKMGCNKEESGEIKVREKVAGLEHVRPCNSVLSFCNSRFSWTVDSNRIFLGKSPESPGLQ